MSNELKLPWTREVLTNRSELSLEKVMGFGCSTVWVVVPSGHYVPPGTPYVMWDIGEDGSFTEVTAQRSFEPLWSSARALDDHPERVIFVPKEYRKNCLFYPIPEFERGLLCTVVLTDGTEGVIVCGEYPEGDPVIFTTMGYLVAFFRTQVVEFSYPNIRRHTNPAFRRGSE